MWQSSSKIFINYDDGPTFGQKSLYVKNSGLGGINVFDTSGDTDSAELMLAVQSVLPYVRRRATVPVTVPARHRAKARLV